MIRLLVVLSLCSLASSSGVADTLAAEHCAPPSADDILLLSVNHNGTGTKFQLFNDWSIVTINCSGTLGRVMASSSLAAGNFCEFGSDDHCLLGPYNLTLVAYYPLGSVGVRSPQDSSAASTRWW